MNLLNSSNTLCVLALIKEATTWSSCTHSVQGNVLNTSSYYSNQKEENNKKYHRYFRYNDPSFKKIEIVCIEHKLIEIQDTACNVKHDLLLLHSSS